MARKIDVKLILELRAAKMSRNMIAETRHISSYIYSLDLSLPRINHPGFSRFWMN